MDISKIVVAIRQKFLGDAFSKSVAKLTGGAAIGQVLTLGASPILARLYFDRMLDPDTNQTLWEEWWRDGTGRTGEVVLGRTRSDAQTESAFPPALFGEYLLGLRPVAPGLKTVLLSLPDTDLTRISGSLPSPMGALEVSWDLEAGTLRLVIPEGMQVQVEEPNFEKA